MAARWLACLVATAAASGMVTTKACDDEGNRPRKDSEVKFEVVVDEAACGLDEPMRVVIRDDAVWAELWSAIHRTVEPVPERPQVDFSRHMLIAVALGTRRSGGFDISVQNVTATEAGIEVAVLESEPAAGAMVGMSLTQPVEVVLVARSGDEVVFVDHTTTRKPQRR